MPPDFPPPWAVSWGDDRHGIWAELEVNGVVQRLRWIPPGEFTMGSPDDDDLAFEDEKPAHRVRLTEGFWLADTTCTQALWLAVLGGENPSHFEDDPAKPVEQVSWDDADRFLQALSTRLSDGLDMVEAELPTEAQWEYACRAGGSTRFSFGHEISTDRVNFSGKVRFQDMPSAWGEPRDKTVAVKSLPANAWGLYEMHGNVWEWCADGRSEIGFYRDYPNQGDSEILENPSQGQGQDPSAERVLRGGAWSNDARSCRSAFRFAVERGECDDRIGFRFVLRSSGPA